MSSLLLFRIGWKYLLRHPLQTCLMIFGITLGVAVMVAIDLANTSASRAFDLSTEAIAGKATHQITGGLQGLDTTIYTQLRQTGLIENLTPVITEFVTSPQLGNRPFTLLGIDPFTDGPFRNYFGSDQPVPIEQLTSFLTRPGAILISAAVAERYGLKVCSDLIHWSIAAYETACVIDISIGGIQRRAYIAGLLEPLDPLSLQALDSLILADIATAQELTGRLGKIDRIDLILPEVPTASMLGSPTASKDNFSIQDDLLNLLGPDLRLNLVEARSGAVREMTNAFRVNLTALSLLALLVGLFLIYNTITFSVVQRRSLFGALRCIGMTRREVFVLVVGEATLIGLIGSTLGILLGILLGQGAIQLVTRTINDLFFVVNVRGVQIPPSSVIKGLIIGLAATLLTAAPPGWEAASTSPNITIHRFSLEDKANRGVRITAALGTFLAGLGGVILVVIRTNSLVISFAATFMVVVGIAMLTPAVTLVLMRGMIPLLGKILGILGRMAPHDVIQSISRTSIAVAALMVAVSVTIGVTLMVNSFRSTVEAWLSQTLQGDIYISAPGQTAAQPGEVINPRVIQALQQSTDISDIALLRAINVNSTLGPVSLSAVTYPVADTHQFLRTDVPLSQIWEKMQAGGVIVSEPFANRFNLPAQGAVLELFTDYGVQAFPIIGVFYDYASTQGIVRMEMSTFRSYWQDDHISAIALFLDLDVSVEQKTRELQDQLSSIQTLLVRSNQGLRTEALNVFNRTFAITGAMQLLATLVAFIGVLSALMALQLEKQRQMGILHAIGLTIQQARGLIFLQTSLMGFVAGLLSLPTGYILSAILIYIINLRSFGWTLQMQVEAGPFFLAMLIAVSAAILAGIYPTVRLQKISATDAIRSE